MKQLVLLAVSYCILVTACQKKVNMDGIGNGTAEDNDSIIRAGDQVMYEVITKDSLGWFGAWSDSTGKLVTGKLDSVSYGNPVFFPGGWTYSFTCPNQPFQALISVDAAEFQDDITVNLYKNGRLIKSSTNNPVIGFAKLISLAETDSLVGTAQNPIVTYEVLVTDPDTSKFQSDSWLGVWVEADGQGSTTVTDGTGDPYTNSMLNLFGMPSGWRRTFRPEHFPFTMRMSILPYSPEGSNVTVNFYVNRQLVKTGSSRDFVSGENFNYTVQ